MIFSLETLQSPPLQSKINNQIVNIRHTLYRILVTKQIAAVVNFQFCFKCETKSTKVDQHLKIQCRKQQKKCECLNPILEKKG